MLIKSRNFSPTKCEGTYDHGGLGWAPGYEKRFEGTEVDKTRYDKNYARMMGQCDTCPEFDKTATKADGSHCKLGKGVPCQE